MTNHRTALAASLGFAATAWLAPMAAFAADAPAGSYSGSCRNVSADDRTLTAECKKTDGSWNQTELRGYRRCISDISNNNGALECQKAEREGGGGRGGSDSTSGNSGNGGASPSGGSGGSGAGASTGGPGGSSPGGSGGASGAGSTSTGGSRGGSDTAGAGGSSGSRGAGGSTGGSTGGSSSGGSSAGASSGGAGGTAGGAGSTGAWNSGAPTGGPASGSPPSNGGSSILPGEGPPGSYQQSCRNVQVRGGDLFAECKTRNGEWYRTTLENVRDCRGDISNDNGRLTCQQADSAGDRRDDRDRDRDSDRGGSDRDGAWGRGDRDSNDGRDYDRGYNDEPRGSYQQTCERIRVRRGDLRAACRTRDGDWRWSSLENYQDCRGDIANNDGRLVCVRFGRITLYEHSGFRGDRRSFTSDADDLGRFADRASSAYVQGGVWQLCTRRFFRGRCVMVDRSIGNFAPLGINDRIESVRRLR